LNEKKNAMVERTVAPNAQKKQPRHSAIKQATMKKIENYLLS
jgi:hypothetical protein